MKKSTASSRVTLNQVAKEVGLSSAAVSMALRGHTRISEATRKRVAEVAGELGYVYNRNAAKLRTGQSDTIGIIISDIANPFYGELVAGIDEVIAATGKISFLFTTRDNSSRQQQLLTRLREQSVDGMIICPAPGTDEELLKQISGWGIPSVQMLRCASEQLGDYVSADYKSGIAALCQHLVNLGHTRIAFIGGNLDHSATRQRLRGFEETLKKHQLEPASVIRCPITREAGKAAIKQLMQQDAPPTAAICYSDTVAFGVLSGLREVGLTPGKDVAVTGFDDVDEARDSWPPLTTAISHPRAIGREAGKLLLRRIKDPEAPARRIIIPTETIIRSSCGQHRLNQL